MSEESQDFDMQLIQEQFDKEKEKWNKKINMELENIRI